MVFWITLIAMVALFVLMKFFAKMKKKAPNYSEKETFFCVSWIVSSTVAVLCATAVFTMFLVIAVNNSTAESPKAELKQQYNILTYQLENNLYDNDNDFGLKSLYNNISAYNSKVAKGKAIQRDFWWGIFYPNIYDELDLIELE